MIRTLKMVYAPLWALWALWACSEADTECMDACVEAQYVRGAATIGNGTLGSQWASACQCDGDGEGLTQEWCTAFCRGGGPDPYCHGWLDTPASCRCTCDEP